jgi:NNP family nitrate/nitrite transporter-like MFS transporter
MDLILQRAGPVATKPWTIRRRNPLMQNSRQAYINLFLATLAFAVAFVAWSLISPLASQIQADLGLDNTATSVLIAVPVLLGSLLRIPLGLLTDRFGGRKVYTALLLFTLLPVAFMGIADSFGAYVLGGLFLGTAGASFAVGVPFVNRWFSPDKQGLALGLYGMGNIGTAVAAFSMPALVNTLGGRQGAFWFYLIPVALMAGIFWLFARDAPGLVKPKSLNDSVAVLRTERMAWILSLFYFLTFGGFVAFANYLPKLLVDWYHLDKGDAGLRAAGFTVVATLARPVGGWLADKIGGHQVLTAVFSVGPIGALALAWLAGSPNMVFSTILFLATALGLGLGNGAVFKLVAQYFPKNTGLVTGIAGCAGGLGGFFPPLLLGFVKDATGSYALGFVLLALFAFLCLAVVLLLRRQAPIPARSTS